MPFEVNVNQLAPFLYEENIKFKILDKNHFQLTYKKDGKEIGKSFPFDKEIVENDFILTVNKSKNINDKTIINLKQKTYFFLNCN